MREANQTITVFNAKVDAEGYDVWYPTIIEGVSWFAQTASTVTADGLRAANHVTIRIPMTADFGGKGYVEPVAYPSASPSGAFTLQQGDLVVNGRERESMTQAQLKTKYGQCVTILGVTDNRHRPREPHIKIVGT